MLFVKLIIIMKIINKRDISVMITNFSINADCYFLPNTGRENFMTSNEPLHRHPAYDRDGGRGCEKPFQFCPSPILSRSDYRGRVVPYGPCPFLSVKRIGASVRRARRTYLRCEIFPR